MEEKKLVGEPKRGYRVLHTGDWHLGLTLDGTNCQAEQEAFLDWLLDFMRKEQVDALVVCGDVFQSKDVTNQTRADYVGLIDKLCDFKGGEVFIISGNHDSSSFMEIDRELYEKRLNIHVIGKLPAAEDNHFVLKDRDGKPRLMLLPVPNIDRSISARYSENFEDLGSDSRYRASIDAYLEATVEAAEKANTDKLPMMMAAHLAVSKMDQEEGADALEEDFIGTLPVLGKGAFADRLSYVALGHIHKPGWVSVRRNIRYCGSPVPTSVDDATDKSVTLLEIADDGGISCDIAQMPAFIKVYALKGPKETVQKAFGDIVEAAKVTTLVSVNYTDTLIDADFDAKLRLMIGDNTKVHLTLTRYNGTGQDSPEQGEQGESRAEVSLEAFTPTMLFEDILRRTGFDEGVQSQLRGLFEEILPIAQQNVESKRTEEDNKLKEAQAKAEQAAQAEVVKAANLEEKKQKSLADYRECRNAVNEKRDALEDRKRELVDAQTRWKAAQAAVDNALPGSRDKACKALGARMKDLEKARDRVARAEKSLKGTEENLEKARQKLASQDIGIPEE